MKSFGFFKFLPGILLVVGGAVGVYYFAKGMSSLSNPFKDIAEVSWAELATLDTQSGVVPPVLKDLESKDVKMAGFVVPLTDNFKTVKEFLLVPDSMSCIHVPPPPTNQMVLVTLDESMNPQLAYGPVWVRGQLEIKSIQSEFGVVAYQMKGQKVKVYEDKNWK